MESKGGYKNSLNHKVDKKYKTDREVVRRINARVVGWLSPLLDVPVNNNLRDNPIGNSIQPIRRIYDGNNEELEKEFRFKLFTDRNEYTFLITIDFDQEDHFMEGSVTSRTPRPGENSSKIKVLPNGSASDELWDQLKDCVLKHELLDKISSDWYQRIR